MMEDQGRKGFFLDAIKHNDLTLAKVPETLRDDNEICLAAVLLNGNYFKHASTRLRDDKEVCLAAVTNCLDKHRCSNRCQAFGFASMRLRDDKGVCLTAVKHDGSALANVSARLQDDKEICLAAVLQNGQSLEHASTRLQDDKEICLVAVLQNGHSLEHASTRLRDDKEVCLAAVTNFRDKRRFSNRGLAFGFASERLKMIKMFVWLQFPNMVGLFSLHP